MPTVSIDDQELERVHTLRHLGITFDRFASGKDHTGCHERQKRLKSIETDSHSQSATKDLVYLVSVCGFGLPTMFASQSRHLDVVQNAALRTI